MPVEGPGKASCEGGRSIPARGSGWQRRRHRKVRPGVGDGRLRGSRAGAGQESKVRWHRPLALVDTLLHVVHVCPSSFCSMYTFASTRVYLCDVPCTQVAPGCGFHWATCFSPKLHFYDVSKYKYALDCNIAYLYVLDHVGQKFSIKGLSGKRLWLLQRPHSAVVRKSSRAQYTDGCCGSVSLKSCLQSQTEA